MMASGGEHHRNQYPASMPGPYNSRHPSYDHMPGSTQPTGEMSPNEPLHYPQSTSLYGYDANLRTNPNQQNYQGGAVLHEGDEDHGAVISSKPGEKNVTKLLKVTTTEEIGHMSYQGTISGNEAEMKLKREGKPCYLTRFSVNHKQHVLSIMTKNHEEGTFEFSHITMKIGADSYEVEGTGKPFGSIHDMLSYYEENPIHSDTRNISSIGKPCSKDGRETAWRHELPKIKEEKKDDIVQFLVKHQQTMEEQHFERQKKLVDNQQEMMEKQQKDFEKQQKDFQQELKEQRQDLEKKLEKQQNDFQEQRQDLEKKLEKQQNDFQKQRQDLEKKLLKLEQDKNRQDFEMNIKLKKLELEKREKEKQCQDLEKEFKKVKQEQVKKEKERQEQEKKEKERQEQEKKEKERQEQEKKEKERQEQEKKEKERQEQEKKQKESQSCALM